MIWSVSIVYLYLCDLSGTALVFIFLPGDFAPQATDYFNHFLERPISTTFENTAHLFISCDSVYAHIAWMKAMDVSLPSNTIFLTDLQGELCRFFHYPLGELDRCKVVVLEPNHTVVYISPTSSCIADILPNFNSMEISWIRSNKQNWCRTFIMEN